MTFSQCFFI